MQTLLYFMLFLVAVFGLWHGFWAIFAKVGQWLLDRGEKRRTAATGSPDKGEVAEIGTHISVRMTDD